MTREVFLPTRSGNLIGGQIIERRYYESEVNNLAHRMYPLWRRPEEPSWIDLSDADRERWRNFAHNLFFAGVISFSYWSNRK